MAASSSSLPPTAASLPGRLLAQAAQRPEACALEVWDESEGSVQRLSFGELARLLRAAIVWHRRTGLRARGAFALLAHNSVSYVALSLGATAVGALSVHLNWRLPAGTTALLLEALDRPVVLLASQLFGDAQGHSQCTAHTPCTFPPRTADNVHRVCGTGDAAAELLQHVPNVSAALPIEPVRAELEELAAALDAEHAAAIDAEVGLLDPREAAVVFYTGGTTGVPKGVPHSHAGLLWLAEKLRLAFPGAETDGTLCFTPFFRERAH